MAVWPAARRDRKPGGIQLAFGAERLFAGAAAATTADRFNPADNGRVTK
jgi:hypothetical protein